MKRFNPFVALTMLLVLGACGDTRSPTSPSRADDLGPTLQIDDGAHAGNSRFFFLPPMVSKPSINAEFHSGLRPRVDICEFNAGGCTSFKSFSASDVRVSAADEQYQVNWDTKTPDVDPAKTYRIQVFIGNTLIGFADVDPVLNGSQLKSVDTDEFIPLVDGRTLPIKFFLGKGVTCSINPANCVEYTVSGATGGSFQSADDRSGTVIPAGAAPVAEFTLTIEKVPVEGAGESCHGVRDAAEVALVQEFNDCYKYTTHPEFRFVDPTPTDGFTRRDRVVVALCTTVPTTDSRYQFLQIFKSDPPPRPVYALDDAAEGVDFPVGLINCAGTIGALPPPPGSGFFANVQYGAKRFAKGLVGLVTPKPAYAIDLGMGGLLLGGDGFSNFRWGIQAHLHPESPLTRSVTTGTTVDFSVLLEAHTHHPLDGEGSGDQASLPIAGASINFTLVDPAGVKSAPVPRLSNTAGMATGQFVVAAAGVHKVFAQHEKGGDVVEFTVTGIEPTGSITGTVFDDGESTLVGAQVRLVGISDPTFKTSTTAGDDGSYSFADLPDGRYSVAAAAVGYLIERHEVGLDGEGRDQVVNFTLSPLPTAFLLRPVGSEITATNGLSMQDNTGIQLEVSPTDVVTWSSSDATGSKGSVNSTGLLAVVQGNDDINTANEVIVTATGATATGSIKVNSFHFNHFPRTLTLVWRPVDGAASYDVTVDHGNAEASISCNGLPANCDRWSASNGATGLVVTRFTFGFVGKQPGRWRVVARDAQGNVISTSEYVYFNFDV